MNPSSLSRNQAAQSLVKRCAKGDAAALTDLYDLFTAFVDRQIRSMIQSPEQIEELRQEVFLYAWQKASAYDPERGAVSTWLAQIARSRAIDRLRKAGARERTRARFALQTAPHAEARIESEVYAGELSGRLRRALGKLPSAQRKAIVLAYFGDMTQSEVAAQTRIPLGTVKTRTQLALRKLRKELGPEAGPAFSA